MKISLNICLILSHIIILCLSNTLVQYPFTLLGFNTTWGAFSYPLIFILTDLTTRLLGQKVAKRVIFIAMVPGLFCSYFISNYSVHGTWLTVNHLAFRVAFASFCAYVLGQLSDIAIFRRLCWNKAWWLAPTVSSIFGNLLDTFCFFFIAFYHGSNAFLSQHWVEIATVDLVFKLLISLGSFIPLYGLILRFILRNYGLQDRSSVDLIERRAGLGPM